MEKCNDNLDVDQLRHPDECGAWWRLRRGFLETHKHNFPLSRLIQLSSCFINNELQGCTYPAAVMEQLKELTNELPPDLQKLRTERKDSMKINFESSEAPSLNVSDRMKSSPTFVKANTEFKSTDVTFQEQEVEVETLPNFEDPFSNVSLLAGKSNFMKSYENFQDTREKSELKQRFNYWLANKITFLESMSGETGSSQTNGSEGLADFFLLEPKVPFRRTRGLSILKLSANFSKVLLKFEFRDVGEGVLCSIFLGGQFIMEHIGITKTYAKSVASEKALDKLRGFFWTFQSKQFIDATGKGITQMGRMGDIKKIDEAISEDNLGNKLLRKMGWTGGGLGKEGNKGITEPVSVRGTMNRQGLGLMAERGSKLCVLSKVRTTVVDYARSSNENDVAIPCQLTSQERAIIHSKCGKLGLASKVRKSRDEQLLIVGRKRTASQLLMHVIHNGGTTYQYDLIAPGQYRCVKANSITEELGMMKIQTESVASEKAPDHPGNLGLHCTVQDKLVVNRVDGGIIREELMGDIKITNESISETAGSGIDNVGNELLNEGMARGGVGTERIESFEEPGFVTSVIKHEDLGLMAGRGSELDLKVKVRILLKEYARSSNQNKLSFSSQFTNVERFIIHRECGKLHLKSKSQGSGEERFLEVTRKQKPIKRRRSGLINTNPFLRVSVSE